VTEIHGYGKRIKCRLAVKSNTHRCYREEGTMNIKLSAANIVSIIILMCILAAMVSIAVMQVVRTVEDIGPKIYVVGGAVVVVGAIIPIMLTILVKHMKKMNQD
jgi:hypothetical protein